MIYWCIWKNNRYPLHLLHIYCILLVEMLYGGCRQMHITDKLIKPLTEAKYLNADNVDRYRSIMRIFYDNYEKLKYWMYQEEVYAQMIQDPYFKDYRIEQCQQDLTALTEWKNLVTIQDTRKVSSIEEFKNKKFRYQMSEYCIFRKNCASVPVERSAIPVETEHRSAG